MLGERPQGACAPCVARVLRILGGLDVPPIGLLAQVVGEHLHPPSTLPTYAVVIRDARFCHAAGRGKTRGSANQSARATSTYTEGSPVKDFGRINVDLGYVFPRIADPRQNGL